MPGQRRTPRCRRSVASVPITIRHPSLSAQETTAGMGGILAGSVPLRGGRSSARPPGAGVAVADAWLETLNSPGVVGRHNQVWWLHDPRPARSPSPRGRVRARATGLFDVLTDSEVNVVLAEQRPSLAPPSRCDRVGLRRPDQCCGSFPACRRRRAPCAVCARAGRRRRRSDDHHAPLSWPQHCANWPSIPATAPVGALNAAQGAIRESVYERDETHSGRRRVRRRPLSAKMTSRSLSPHRS